MTSDTAATRSRPTVFDAVLPEIAYDHLTDFKEAHRIIGSARQEAPIAMGPHAPEVLSYELVHAVLRDPRFVSARGLGLDLQGITSGPLWDRATASILSLDGEAHHRLRRLVSKAFAPRSAERLRTLAVDIITELVDPLTAVRALRCGHRHRPPVSHSGHLRPAGRASPGLALVFRLGRSHKKVFDWNVAHDGPTILGALEEFDAYLEDMIGRRRDTLRDDLISDLIRAEDDGDCLTEEEMVRLAGGLLTAGTDTTRNQLTAAVQVLADHPDQWTLLAEHPELAADAVHELMRYCPIVLPSPARPPRTLNSPGSPFQPAPSCSPTPLRPIVTPPYTSTPIASTSPAPIRRPC